MKFVCECNVPKCDKTFEMGDREYLKKGGIFSGRYLVVPEHVGDGDEVMETGDGWVAIKEEVAA